MTTGVIAIIQARMGSSRLPGKAMYAIMNRPLIDYLLSRLSKSKFINKIILATSTNSENDKLCKFVESKGYDVFRGDEDNVLKRFNEAAIQYSAAHIVRITGDSPLIDHDICDKLIKLYLEQGADYAYLSEHFCEGVDCEVISKSTLSIIYEKSKKKSEQEHVTLYIHNNPEDFSIVKLKNQSDDSHYRFTVDNNEDALVVSNIIENNFDNIEYLTTAEIKQYLDKKPEIKAINNHIMRNEGLIKSLQQDL